MLFPPQPAVISGVTSHPPVADLRKAHSETSKLFSFDREYVKKLTEGDPAVENHFIRYFDNLLRAKLRFRLRSEQEVEDLRQEVYLRVLRALRQGAGVQQPERFGGYVNSVCTNLLFEHFRQQRRSALFDGEMPDTRDTRVDLESDLVSRETREKVQALIAELSPKDRNILKALLFEERDKDEVCRDLGVDRGYLRVLLHRARNRFRLLLTGQKARHASQGSVTI